MSNPPEDLRQIWFCLAHSEPGCAIRGKICQGAVLEAHHIIPRQWNIAWMPQNAILLCRHHHRLAHNEKAMFMLALKGARPKQWQWVEGHKNYSVTWAEIEKALREWTLQETEA